MIKNNKNENVEKPLVKPLEVKPKGKKRKIALISIATFLIFTTSLIGLDAFFDKYDLGFQSPLIIRTPITITERQQLVSPQPEEPKEATESAKVSFNVVEVAHAKEPEPTPTPELIKTAKVTAYSCGGLETEAEIMMNCPSLKNGRPRTATGSEPIPMRTVACDPANLGRIFHLEGIGEVKCTDTGGHIKGAGRFDLYVGDVQEARQWGVKYIKYELL